LPFYVGSTTPWTSRCPDLIYPALNDDELGELGNKIKAIAAASVHVVLNNNYEDQGERNARTLMGLVGRSCAPRDALDSLLQGYRRCEQNAN